MSWTKGDIVSEAFAELALAGYVVDIDPDEQAAALRRLDTMMATWQSQGLRVSYAISADPQGSDMADDSGLPLECVEAVYMGLAGRIAAGKGKMLPPSSKAIIKASFDALVSRQASGDTMEQQIRSGVPRGSGSKPWRTNNRPYMAIPTKTPLLNNDDGGLSFVGDRD